MLEIAIQPEKLNRAFLLFPSVPETRKTEQNSIV